MASVKPLFFLMMLDRDCYLRWLTSVMRCFLSPQRIITRLKNDEHFSIFQLIVLVLQLTTSYRISVDLSFLVKKLKRTCCNLTAQHQTVDRESIRPAFEHSVVRYLSLSAGRDQI